MCGLKCWIRVAVIALIIQSGHLISTEPHNGTAEILWMLSQVAVQGRQKYPSQSQLHPEQFSQYTGPIRPNQGQYGLLQNYPRPRPSLQRPYPEFQKPYPDFQKPSPNVQRPYQQHFPRPYRPGIPKPVPALPPGYHQYQQQFGPPSVMGALQSIVQNDDLHCVPRLLCELTSGPSSGQKQTSFLPFNIDMESIVGLLSAVTGPQTSPLLEFGKAALLGYTSKEKSRPCLYAYPRCPQEPDRLVEYLNNHNGGFFRFFNGVAPSGYPQNPQGALFPQNHPYPQRPVYPQNYRPQYPQNNPHYRPQNLDFYQQKPVFAEKRIQNQFVQYVDSNSAVRFPSRLEDEMNNDVLPPQEALVFPEQVNFNGYQQQVREQKSRRQKAVAFPVNDFDFPKLKQVGLIFPDRTGTGEIRLDPDELDNHHDYGNDYKKLNGGESHFDDRKNSFKFPLPYQEV